MTKKKIFDMGAGYKFKPLNYDMLPYQKKLSLKEEILLLEKQLELKKEYLQFLEMLTRVSGSNKDIENA